MMSLQALQIGCLTWACIRVQSKPSAICCSLVYPKRAHALHQAQAAPLRHAHLQVYMEDVDPDQALDIDAQLAPTVRARVLESFECS